MLQTKKGNNMSFSSNELQEIQNLLDLKIRSEIKKPNTDYNLVSNLSDIAQKVDEERRIQWKKENFGLYEEMAEQCLDAFSSDDIPF